MSPADHVLGVAVLDAGDPGVLAVIPGLSLPLQRLHHLLPEPVHGLEQHRVQRPEVLRALD